MVLNNLNFAAVHYSRLSEKMYFMFHDLSSCLNALHMAHFLERDLAIVYGHAVPVFKMEQVSSNSV